jgi:hypothetical protein
VPGASSFAAIVLSALGLVLSAAQQAHGFVDDGDDDDNTSGHHEDVGYNSLTSTTTEAEGARNRTVTSFASSTMAASITEELLLS